MPRLTPMHELLHLARGWSLAGVRDLSGDGTSDVVWYDATTGKVDLWKIANGQWAGSVDVGPHPLGWQPAGIGDLNGDGINDMLWHNPTTGNVDLWKLVNGQWAGSVDIGSHPLGYQVAGIAGFQQRRHRRRALVQLYRLAASISGKSPTATGPAASTLDRIRWAGSLRASEISITTAPATLPGTIPRPATSTSGRS